MGLALYFHWQLCSSLDSFSGLARDPGVMDEVRKQLSSGTEGHSVVTSMEGQLMSRRASPGLRPGACELRDLPPLG